jgi:hypothetical protein
VFEEKKINQRSNPGFCCAGVEVEVIVAVFLVVKGPAADATDALQP